MLCTEDDNSCYRNVCKMSVVSFALAVVFIIRLFSTSAFRVPCPLFSWKMKYSPRTLENVKMSSFLHFLFCTVIISGVTRALSQGGKFSWKGPTGHCTGPTSQHSENIWEVMVNLGVDSYAKTLNHLKIIGLTRKTTTYWKPNEYENRNIEGGGPVFTFRLPG